MFLVVLISIILAAGVSFFIFTGEWEYYSIREFFAHIAFSFIVMFITALVCGVIFLIVEGMNRPSEESYIDTEQIQIKQIGLTNKDIKLLSEDNKTMKISYNNIDIIFDDTLENGQAILLSKKAINNITYREYTTYYLKVGPGILISKANSKFDDDWTE